LNQPKLSDLTIVIQQVQPNEKVTHFQISLQKCLVLRFIYELETEFYAKRQGQLVSELDSKSIAEVMQTPHLAKQLPPILCGMFNQPSDEALMLCLKVSHPVSDRVLHLFFEFTYTKRLS